MRVLFIALLLLAPRAAFAEMAVEVVTVYYRDARELADLLAKDVSEGGRIVADPNSNSLVIRDWGPAIEAIKAKIKKLDVLPRRVRVTAGFVEREKVAAFGNRMKWFFSTPDWSQGSLPPELAGMSGIGATPLGAVKTLETFNRQFILLDGDKEGTIEVAHRIPDAGWFIMYGIEHGVIPPDARFRDIGAEFSIKASVSGNGSVMLTLTPRLTRRDGGSGISLHDTHLLLVIEPGQALVVAGNAENGESFGKMFFTLFQEEGKTKELVMVVEAAVDAP
ncbi:MAG: hypothetical protein HZA04_03120 [Nitrospinae bacterium]|nr:hypothetical protein [Nitrospinota bacterium]